MHLRPSLIVIIFFFISQGPYKKKAGVCGPFNVCFPDEEIDGLYQGEVRFGKLLRPGTPRAVLMACLGLFGPASLMAEQRTKEIGIRKVPGSSTAGIAALLSKDFLLRAGIGNVIARQSVRAAAANPVDSLRCE